MRLIDADALKRELGYTDEWYKRRTIRELIDNAQTIKPTITCKECDGYEAGYSAGQHDARPKGEWIPQTAYDGFTYWKCSKCGKKNDFAITKFCFHCGADMRKKEEPIILTDEQITEMYESGYISDKEEYKDGND